MNPSVARISIDPAQPGAFVMNNNSEVYDKTTAMYLRNHAKVKWLSVTGATAFDSLETVKFMAGNYPMAIGRKNVSGVTYLGRVRSLI